MKNQLMWPAVGNKFLPEVLGRKRQEARHFFWRVLHFCVKSKGRCCMAFVCKQFWLPATHKFSHLRAYMVFFSLVPRQKCGGFLSILPAASVKRTLLDYDTLACLAAHVITWTHQKRFVIRK